MKDFFVSYTQVDRKWAEWVAWQLEAKGYSVVIQAWDFPPGSNFVQQMREAAVDCRRTLAILSPAYLESLYGMQEWNAAMAADPTGQEGKLVPVRVEPCELEGLDRPVVYLDLVGADSATARERLLQGVRRERGKPSREPEFQGTKVGEPDFPSEGAVAKESTVASTGGAARRGTAGALGRGRPFRIPWLWVATAMTLVVAALALRYLAWPRALSPADLEKLRVHFAQVVDRELQKAKYQEERGDFTTFKVGVEDYERLRVELSAAIEGALGADNRVVLAPQDSFFNVGAQLADIKARYREEFEQIAIKTVGARLLAIDAFEQQMDNVVTVLRTPGVPNFDIETNWHLEEVWSPELIQERIASLQEKSQALQSFESDQANLTSDIDRDLEASRKAVEDWHQKHAILLMAELRPEDTTSNPAGLSPERIRELKRSVETEVDAAQRRYQERWAAQFQSGSTIPADAIDEATKSLRSAVNRLESLKSILADRSELISEWVRQILVEEQEAISIKGSRVAAIRVGG